MMTVLNHGVVTAEALVLDTPVSFWGGFDPVTGKILEASHPQRTSPSWQGPCDALCQGISGTPAGVAESIRVGNGPAAIVLAKPDAANIVGAKVASQLYDIDVPVTLRFMPIQYAAFQTSQYWHIDTQQGREPCPCLITTASLGLLHGCEPLYLRL